MKTILEHQRDPETYLSNLAHLEIELIEVPSIRRIRVQLHSLLRAAALLARPAGLDHAAHPG